MGSNDIVIDCDPSIRMCASTAGIAIPLPPHLVLPLEQWDWKYEELMFCQRGERHRSKQARGEEGKEFRHAGETVFHSLPGFVRFCRNPRVAI
jgi:hypothetical protein